MRDCPYCLYICLLFICIPATTAICGDVHFAPYKEHSVGLKGSTTLFAAGDLNRDGMDDLVIVYGSNDAIGKAEVWLSNGFGDFAVQKSFETRKGGVAQPVLADMDGDGKLDLLLNMGWPSEVTVLYGMGDGTFSPVTTTVKGLLHGVKDLNQDGIDDLVVAVGDTSSLVIRYGEKGRTFGNSAQWGDKAYCINIADFNHDGRSDLLTTYQAAEKLYLSGADGKYQVKPVNLGISNIIYYKAWDIDMDGDADIAVLTREKITILKGMGDGSFSIKDIYKSPELTEMFLTEDFDGDGRKDIITVTSGWTYNLQPAALLRSKPDSSFHPAQIVTLQEVIPHMGSYSESSPVSMPHLRCIAADFNGDGKADLAWLEGEKVRVAMNITGLSAFLQISAQAYAGIAFAIAALVGAIAFALHKRQILTWNP